MMKLRSGSVAMDKDIVTGLAAAARAIGRRDFYERLISALSSGITWESRCVVRYSLYAPPEYLVEEGLDPELLAVYLRGYYRVDPYYKLFREESRSGVVSLTRHLRGRDESSYVMIYASLAAWTDELAVMLPGHGGTAIGIFWETSKNAFGDSEVSSLEDVYPLVAGLHDAHTTRLLDHVGSAVENDGIVSAHAIVDQGAQYIMTSPGWPDDHEKLDINIVRLVAQGGGDVQMDDGGLLHSEKLDEGFALAPGGWLVVYDPGGPAPAPVSLAQAVQDFRCGDLTPRERQIVGLIVSGLSNAEIASELGIEVGSVKNHRGRLYKKLEITGERDLFKLFLDHIVSIEAS